MDLYGTIDKSISTFIDSTIKRKLSKSDREELVDNLHPLHIDVISAFIYLTGFLVFIWIWYFIKADNYLSKEHKWVKTSVFIIYIFYLLVNIWLSTELPSNYKDELEIQRSIEKAAFRLSTGSLALAIFTMNLKNLFTVKTIKLARLPFLFLSVAFILSNFILFYINLPKMGIFVHYYRNIISQLLNLSIIYITAAMIYVIAVIRSAEKIGKK